MRTSKRGSASVVYYICYCTEYGRLDMRRFSWRSGGLQGGQTWDGRDLGYWLGHTDTLMILIQRIARIFAMQYLYNTYFQFP